VEGSPEDNSRLIEEISIHSPITGHTYLFPWGQWAGPGQEYLQKRAELDSSANTSTLTQSSPTTAGLVGEQCLSSPSLPLISHSAGSVENYL